MVDYSYVSTAARIALYDDLLSSPQVIEIPPAETTDFIGKLSAEIYERAKGMGGNIPFSVIKQVTENFIHADFREIVVSILNGGNTIRFADQGPGINDKQRAQLPGFSSATNEMKKYIDGVGSGLPIVREYLDIKNGVLTLDDNLNGGSVVTLSLNNSSFSYLEQINTSQNSNISNNPVSAQTTAVSMVASSVSTRGKQILELFRSDNTLGVQDISTMTGIPLSSTHSELRKLEESGLIEKIGKKRILTEVGKEVVKVFH